MAVAVEVERQTTASTPAKSLPFRVGHGFDLHRLEPGYPLIIGGINIPHEKGCEAHSDGKIHTISQYMCFVTFQRYPQAVVWLRILLNLKISLPLINELCRFVHL